MDPLAFALALCFLAFLALLAGLCLGGWPWRRRAPCPHCMQRREHEDEKVIDEQRRTW